MASQLGCSITGLMMMIVGEFAFYLFMEVLMYSLGRLMIPVLSFGRARAVRTKEIFSRNLAKLDRHRR